jgi:hypothetical protein
MSNIFVGRFSLSADATIRHCMSTFTITIVYGPSRRVEKASFLQHMRSLKPDHDSKWLILRDFNPIYKARDKNNRKLNLRLMRSFRREIEFGDLLKELRLQNRNYT